jgi:hypothetical protein
MAYRPAIRQPAARLQQNSLNLAGRRQTLSNGAGRSRPPRPTAPSRLLAPYGASRTGFRRTRYPDAFWYTSAATAHKRARTCTTMAHRKASVSYRKQQIGIVVGVDRRQAFQGPSLEDTVARNRLITCKIATC